VLDPNPQSILANPSVALVLGAGFSKCAALPLQAEFPKRLLNHPVDDPLNQRITEALEEFLRLTFGWQRGDDLPSLESIFTLIDLSANTGHHLGYHYSPRKLRALRRLLIYRVFSILDLEFKPSKDIKGLLNAVLPKSVNPAFIVLNWDIVLERHLETTASGYHGVDYGVNERPWVGAQTEEDNKVRIIKIHGSANWVYCDNCRQIFFDRDRKLSLSIKAGILSEDLELFDSRDRKQGDWSFLEPNDRACIWCGSPVGPHIATFSFRKSFRTNADGCSSAIPCPTLTTSLPIC
jgi:hypothetical protein